MIKLFYENVDISDAVSIKRCYHDMYAGGISDAVHLDFFDTKNLWDKWSPQTGEEIRIGYGSISTGAMFISSIVPRNGMISIIAQSAPMSGYAPRSKAWQKVRFLQIASEIAERNNLSLSLHGVSDHIYAYIFQDNESDFSFLYRITKQEGFSFLVYDKTLVVFDEAYMEAVAPQEKLPVAIDADYKYTDRRAEAFGSCTVVSGQYEGSYSVAADGRVLRPQNVLGVGNVADAERFAKGLLRFENKRCRGGYIRTQVLTGYAPASTVYLLNERAPSWDGSVFIDHIRNDYSKGQSKIFFRKPLEGY